MPSPVAPAAAVPRPATTWSWTLLAFALVAAATLRAAWPTLDRYFIGDDFAYVGRFSQLTFREWPALFARDWSGGIMGLTLPELRPFAALTFMVDARCWGLNPLGYHLTNLALDTGCAWLVMLILWRVHAAHLGVACAAAVFFAWHPAHAETGAWITGRVDLLGTLAYLAAFLAGARYLQTGARRWLTGTWLAYAVGCFSKEFCLTAPLALLLWVAVFRAVPAGNRTRKFGPLFAGYVLIAAGFLLCRRLAFGPGAGGVTPLAWLSPEYAERQIDYLRWWLPNLYHFGRDYRPQLVAMAPALVTGFVSVSGLIVLLWRWRSPATTSCRAVTGYALGWYALTTLPLAVATYFSPRHLYLATAGLSLAAGLVAAGLSPRRWVGIAALSVVAIFSFSRLDHARTPWRHAAKISERFAQATTQALATLPPGAILLIDAPAVHEGVWMWSWAAPFAYQPPFHPATALPVLTRPEVYISAGRWLAQPSLTQLTQATGAVLLTVNAQREVTPLTLTGERLRRPAEHLTAQLQAGGETDLAWREFVSSLRAP